MKKYFNTARDLIQKAFEKPTRRTFFTLCSPYVWIVFSSILALCLYTAATFWHQYKNVHKWAKEEARREALRLDDELKKMFKESENLLANIGKEILKNRPEDLMQIWNDVKDVFGENKTNSTSFVWPTLGWITHTNLQIVNSKEGILSEPIDMSMREYTRIGKEYPWKLLFSKSGQGYPQELSGLFVIPFGMSVVNESGELVGYCGAAYNCEVLAKNLDLLVNNRSLNFILLENDRDIVVESPKTSITQFNISDYPSSYTKKIDDTPFTIVTYFSNEAVNNILHQVIAPSLIKIIMEGICLIFLICFFLHGVINKNHELADAKKNLEHAIELAHHSDRAKEEFLRSVRQNLKAPFVTIVTYTDILLKQLKGEINLEIPREKQIDFLGRIEQGCQDLETLTTQVVDLECKDIKALLEECLIIISKEAYVKGVTLESHITDFPKWIIDELRFKQIIVGLLCRCLQFCRKGDFLFINASLEGKNTKPVLKIIIKDTGIGLNEEERTRIQSLYQGNLHASAFTHGMSLELSSIERLVDLLHGTCHIESTWKVGTLVTLLFPYRSKEESGLVSKNDTIEKSSAILYDWDLNDVKS